MMGPSVLLLLLLLTSEPTTTHGGLMQLYHMITQVTGKKAIPYYSSYGCYCGLGGKGRPKDATDRCCQRHDCCYDRLERWECFPKTTSYSYSYYSGQIWCGSSASWCQEGICSCDQALALCLKQNIGQYKKKYTFYPNFLCGRRSPSCSS